MYFIVHFNVQRVLVDFGSIHLRRKLLDQKFGTSEPRVDPSPVVEHVFFLDGKGSQIIFNLTHLNSKIHKIIFLILLFELQCQHDYFKNEKDS